MRWVEFLIGDLFDKIPTQKLPYKVSDLKGKHGNLPALTSGTSNQGLSCYVPRDGASVLKNCLSVASNGNAAGTVFYQSDEFTVLQDAYAIQLKNEKHRTREVYLFLTAVLNKTLKYDWSNKATWERVKSQKILLPVSGGAIDFDYMSGRIAEIEAEQIAEMEAYLAELDNYR